MEQIMQLLSKMLSSCDWRLVQYRNWAMAYFCGGVEGQNKITSHSCFFCYMFYMFRCGIETRPEP